MGFFSEPYKFSFKDVLAIAFLALFFYASLRALASEQALELVKALLPLAGIVLGGYFGHEVALAYFNRPGGYNQVGYRTPPAAGQGGGDDSGGTI